MEGSEKQFTFLISLKKVIKEKSPWTLEIITYKIFSKESNFTANEIKLFKSN